MKRGVRRQGLVLGLTVGLVLGGSLVATAALTVVPDQVVAAADPPCPSFPPGTIRAGVGTRMIVTPSTWQPSGKVEAAFWGGWCGDTYRLVLLPSKIELASGAYGAAEPFRTTFTLPRNLKPGGWELALFETVPGSREFFETSIPITITGGPGGMERVMLSPSLTGSRFGDVLAVDAAGGLWRYPASASGQLGSGSRFGPGWKDIDVYPTGDWDRDGRNDLIAVKNGIMYLYRGNGKGGLTKAEKIGHGWGPFRVIPAGDLTGDRIPDLLAVNKQTGALLLYSGNGKGGFKSGSIQVGHGWKNMQLFAAGDLNKDGKADILGVTADGRLLFYAGKGTGFFHKAQQVGHGWKNLDLIAGADLNGDGVADIGARAPGGYLNLYLGKGGGTFAKPIKLANPQ